MHNGWKTAYDLWRLKGRQCVASQQEATKFKSQLNALTCGVCLFSPHLHSCPLGSYSAITSNLCP